MHLRNNLLILHVLAVACSGSTFAVLGTQPGAWPSILAAAGHMPATVTGAEILVAPPGTAAAAADWQNKVQNGAALILEGSSPLADSFGFHAHLETTSVIHIVDVHNPALPVIWDKAVEMARTDLPSNALVFAKDRWTAAPVVAGYRSGSGAVLWVGISPGQNGYERFPYLMQALADLGFEPSIRSASLWAFFDYSYRTRADSDYLAERWRRAGISALHVASWHFYDIDTERDAYLKALIEACHRHGILVYAWMELPHVSEKFWSDHPQWREQTASLQDAELDWRKLMNLQNQDCAAAVRQGLHQMMDRFDWDGVNLAELYFESLEGAGNPARFTPMNAEVRAQFQSESGWDPISLWSKRTDTASLRQFLDYRAGLVRAMQSEWLSAVETFKPGIDIVLTHVDDRFDAGMKDLIGADAAAALPLLDRHAFSFLIEDPATVWNLGAQRYPEIAKRYRPLTAHTDKLAIDINIVDRYQDVYPTRQQTGTELFELVHTASTAFSRVALYFENSILKPDLELLASSSAVVSRYTKEGSRVSIDSPAGVELVWSGDALVDGKPWPIQSKNFVRLPAGPHAVDPSTKRSGLLITDLNANLISASVEGRKTEFQYSSDSRAIVRFERKPNRMELDSQPFPATCVEASDCSILLPRGNHRVTAD